MKSNMTDEDLRRWAIQEILTRRGYGNAPFPTRIAEADTVVKYIRDGVVPEVS